MAKSKQQESLEAAADTEEAPILIDDLRGHLNTVLDKWTKSDQGEQGYDTIRSWLSLTPEDVKSLPKKSKAKGKDDIENPSSSSYIQLIEQIAALFKKSSEQRKYKKEQIVNRCLAHHADILTMIKEFVDSATSLKRKRESESTLNAPFAKKKASGAEVHAEMAGTTSGSETDPSDPENISEEENIYMETVAVEVKQMFRQICFTKWSKDWLPVLVLNPYDIPQKEFRDEWKKKYTKYSEQKSKKNMEHLFLWYGCKNDSEAYGWAKEKELMSYEEAKEKGLTVVPKRITQKQESGKVLTKGELQMLDGFIEAENALELSLADRFKRHSKEVVEESAEVDLGDLKDEEESDEEPGISKLPQKKKKLQGKTKGTELKSSGDQPVPLKKVKAKPTTTSQSSPKSELPSPKKVVLSVDEDDFVENDVSSNDVGDADDFSFKGDEEEPSSEYDDGIYGKNAKKQNCASKQNEKKKTEKKKRSEAASAKRNKKVKSHPTKRRYSVPEEKAELDLNETVVLPIMHKLEDALTKKDREEIFSFLDEIERVVPGIAPSFVERYGIGLLIKRTRKTFGDAEVTAKTKAITDAMKLVYNEKVDRRPKKFESEWKAYDNKLKQDENKVVVDATEVPPTSPKQDYPPSPAPELKAESRGADFSVPRKSGISSEMVVAPAPAMESNTSVVIKPKKPKFSLGAMIDGTKQSGSSSATPHAPKEHKTVVMPSLVIKRGPPKWLTEVLPESVLDPTAEDKDRAIGKEFIDCIDVDWPEDVLQQINFESFVHHIEQAVYDWSQEDQASKSSNIRRGNAKVLKYPENYWMKIRDIVSGLSGRNDRDQDYRPKLVDGLLRGDYQTPMDLVKLPGSSFYQSMKIQL